jgi:hypothetical protein
VGTTRFSFITCVVGTVIPIVARIPRVVAPVQVLVAHLFPIAEESVRWTTRLALASSSNTYLVSVAPKAVITIS